MNTRRGIATATATIGLFAGALASESVTTNGAGGGFYSGQADAQLQTPQDDFDIQINNNLGSGSGGLFAMNTGVVGGQNVINLGIATADHVMDAATQWSIGIPDGLALITLSNQSFTENYVFRGNSEDLGFIGITIAQNQVGANTWNFLQTLTDVNGILGTASATTGLVIHNYGYGLSGEYLTAGGPVLTTNNPANVTGFAYRTNFPARDQFGVGRVTNQSSLGLQTVKASSLGLAYNQVSTGNAYSYTGLTWTLPTGNPAHLGQINSGDSGGPIISFTGAMVGVNTVAKGVTVAGGENFLFGDNFAGVDAGGNASNFSGAGVGFNQADLNFLTNQFNTMPTPEPASFLGIGVLGIGLIARRRRQLRERSSK